MPIAEAAHFLAILVEAENMSIQNRKQAKTMYDQMKRQAKEMFDQINQRAEDMYEQANQQAAAHEKGYRDLKLKLQQGAPGPSGMCSVPGGKPSVPGGIPSVASVASTPSTSKASTRVRKGKKKNSVTSTPAATVPEAQSLFSGDSDGDDTNRPELSVIQPIRNRNEIALAGDVMEFSEESNSGLPDKPSSALTGVSSASSTVVSSAKSVQVPKRSARQRSKREVTTTAITTTITLVPSAQHPSSSSVVAAMAKASNKRKRSPLKDSQAQDDSSSTTNSVPPRELFISELKLRKPTQKRFPRAYSEQSKCPGCNVDVGNFEQHYSEKVLECAHDGYKTHCKFSYYVTHGECSGTVFIDEEFRDLDPKENALVCASCGDLFESSTALLTHLKKTQHIGYTAPVANKWTED